MYAKNNPLKTGSYLFAEEQWKLRKRTPNKPVLSWILQLFSALSKKPVLDNAAMRRGSVLGATIVFCAQAVMALSDPPHLRFATSEFPPYSYQDEKGQVRGFMTEIVEELRQELKAEGYVELGAAKIEFFPWKRAYTLATEEANVLMYPLGSEPEERNKIFHWLGPKLARNISIYSLKETAKFLHLNSKTELKDKLVGVTASYSWATDLQRLGAHVDETTDDRILLLKLLGHRMPYMAMDSAVEKHVWEQMQAENPQYRKISFEKILVFSTKGFRTWGIAHRSNPRLIQILEKAFHALENRGVIKKIQRRYPDIEVLEVSP